MRIALPAPSLRSTLLSALLVLLALPGCGGATATTAPPDHAASAQAHRGAPFLWRVESPDGRVSHLMGTVHGGISLDEALPAPHDALLSSAAAVYVESLPDDPLQIAAFGQVLLAPSAMPLSTVLGVETFEALAAQQSAFPRERLDALEPWAAFFIVLSLRMVQALQAHAQAAGEDPTVPGMDAVIIQQSRARQLPPQPLEQLTELAAIFRGVDQAVYVGMLTEFAAITAETEEVSAQQLTQLVDAYRAGDLDAVASLIDALNTSETTAPFFRALIADRNELWMSRLRALFGRGGAFVAVGAGHMAGPEGLLTRLAAEGFVVTRL